MNFTKTAVHILLAIVIQQQVMAQSYFKTDFPQVWQRATAYTLEVAAAMPPEKYSYKPTAESMSFREQLTHLIQNIAFLSGRITGTQPDFFKGKNPADLSKEELQAHLQEAFKYVGKLMEEVDENALKERVVFGGAEMLKENIFYLMRDHVTHHRGQAVLYLRINGIDAPKYRGW